MLHTCAIICGQASKTRQISFRQLEQAVKACPYRKVQPNRRIGAALELDVRAKVDEARLGRHLPQSRSYDVVPREIGLEEIGHVGELTPTQMRSRLS